MDLDKKYLETSINLPYFKNKTDKNLLLYNSSCKASSTTIIKYFHAKKPVSPVKLLRHQYSENTQFYRTFLRTMFSFDNTQTDMEKEVMPFHIL